MKKRGNLNFKKNTFILEKKSPMILQPKTGCFSPHYPIFEFKSVLWTWFSPSGFRKQSISLWSLVPWAALGPWLLYLYMLGISCTMIICTITPQSILLWTCLRRSWLTQMHFVLTDCKENKSSLEQRFILRFRLETDKMNRQYLVVSKMKKTPRTKQNTIMECV